MDNLHSDRSPKVKSRQPATHPSIQWPTKTSWLTPFNTDQEVTKITSRNRWTDIQMDGHPKKHHSQIKYGSKLNNFEKRFPFIIDSKKKKKEQISQL